MKFINTFSTFDKQSARKSKRKHGRIKTQLYPHISYVATKIRETKTIKKPENILVGESLLAILYL